MLDLCQLTQGTCPDLRHLELQMKTICHKLDISSHLEASIIEFLKAWPNMVQNFNDKKGKLEKMTGTKYQYNHQIPQK